MVGDYSKNKKCPTCGGRCLQPNSRQAVNGSAKANVDQHVGEEDYPVLGHVAHQGNRLASVVQNQSALRPHQVVQAVTHRFPKTARVLGGLSN